MANALNNQASRMYMICKDLNDDSECVIVGILDHKYAEVATFFDDGSLCYEGGKVRIDELEFTGRYYEIEHEVPYPAA